MAEEKVSIKVMKKWFDDIWNDPNEETTEQEMAYIMYATLMYGFYGEKINIGEVFGAEFKGLNRSMPNIYGQIDNIKDYAENAGAAASKYDSDAIKELRLKGLTAKEVCAELGYPEEKARSITSNKGWVEAGKELRQGKNARDCAGTVQKSQKSVQSYFNKSQTENTENTDSVPENTEKSEICTDLSQTESQKSVQKSQISVQNGFNF